MAQKGWNYLLTHIIVEVAKALGGSFKLVTLAPKTVREMTQLPKETQKNGDRQTNQKGQINTQRTHLGYRCKKHTRPGQPGCMNWSW